jgi:SAM-dependent methyltransferase
VLVLVLVASMPDQRRASAEEAVTAVSGVATDMGTVRRNVGRHIVGSGVELGPGPKPFPVDYPAVSTTFLDRWEPDENRGLFQELGPSAEFVKPDIVCNLDTDKLKMLEDASQDFVIASHVLEHMADPIGLLDEVHRVLKPGGVALILLPDMRRTFDRSRPVTSLDHLVAEYEAGVTEVDDAHILEFIQHTEVDGDRKVEGKTEAERAELFEWHRQRSIHVHCWSEDDFQPIIDYVISALGHEWEFVDGILTDDEGPEGIEFGYVLRRSTVPLPPDVRAQRFEATRAAWADTRRQINATVRNVEDATEAHANATAALAEVQSGAVGYAVKAARRARPHVARVLKAAGERVSPGPHT